MFSFHSDLYSGEGEFLLRHPINGRHEAECGYSPVQPQNTPQNSTNSRVSEDALVYGHINRPFSRYIPFQHYAARVDVYNTGGWVVVTVKPARAHGGAMVLVNDKLNAAAIRM